MPLFRFHLVNQIVDAEDAEGEELADLDEAYHKALRGIRDLLGHEVRTGTIDLRGRIDIENADGVLLLSVPFADALNIVAGR